MKPEFQSLKDPKLVITDQDADEKNLDELITDNRIQPSKQLKVQIIDDNEAIIESVRNNLQKAGYKVVTHNKSLGALLSIMDERPDLILLEIKIPLLAGPMLCQLIRKNRMIAKTPILLYSSLNEKQ